MLTGEGKFLVRFVARELIELVIAENPEISVDDEKGISAIANESEQDKMCLTRNNCILIMT